MMQRPERPASVITARATVDIGGGRELAALVVSAGGDPQAVLWTRCASDPAATSSPGLRIPLQALDDVAATLRKLGRP